MKNPTETIAGLAQRLAEMGRSARANIDQVRADIAAAQGELSEIERAPVDDAEVQRRAALIVAYAADAARSKSAFTIFARPTGWDESRAWVGLEDLPALSIAAVTSPAELTAAIVREAKAATSDFSPRGPMSEKLRNSEAARLRQRIDALERREEAAVRALAEAGILVERRRGARDLADVDTADLQVGS